MTSSDTNPVFQALEGYQSAVLAKDAGAFAALYAADVRVFDMWGAWSFDGLEAWCRETADWFGSLGDERVRVGFSDVQASVSQDLAIGHAFVSFAALGPDGVELRSMSNRLTLVLQRRGGAWKITHQHTSAPADPQTAKLIFKR